jgi:glutamate dehydrogenase
VQPHNALSAESHWQTLARMALADDLADLQRAIALDVVGQDIARAQGAAPKRAAWEQRSRDALERSHRLLAELGDAKGVDLAMVSVALRELRNLA